MTTAIFAATVASAATAGAAAGVVVRWRWWYLGYDSGVGVISV